jgi:hypothetical protein
MLSILWRFASSKDAVAALHGSPDRKLRSSSAQKLVLVHEDEVDLLDGRIPAADDVRSRDRELPVGLGHVDLGTTAVVVPLWLAAPAKSRTPTRVIRPPRRCIA